MMTDVMLAFDPYIVPAIIIAGILIFCVIVIFVARWWFRKGNLLPYAFQKRILLIQVPKDVHHGEEKQQETSDQLREKISISESLWNTIGGLKAQKGFHAWLFGRSDHVSLEVVAHRGKIAFYIAVPRYLERYLEQQIHAHYPDAVVQMMEDYNIFTPTGSIHCADIRLLRDYIFPIKTYRKIEGDPFNAVLNTLSKLAPDEGAAIQIVIRSANKKWHKRGAKVASEMQQGRKLHEAMRRAGGKSLWAKLQSGWGNSMGDILASGYSGKTKDQRDVQKKEKDSYRLSPMEEEMVKGLEEKTSKAGVDVNIRVIVSSENTTNAGMLLQNVANAFSQYNIYQYGNGFRPIIIGNNAHAIHDFIYRNFKERHSFVLNTEEIASMYHFPLSKTEVPNILWLTARKAAPPSDMPTEGILLGKSKFRGIETNVRMLEEDRLRHMYIIGMTGSGKSTLMAEMAKQDIREGKGICIIDPHGSLVEDVLECIPPERADDVVLFEPADMERPVGLNMLESKHDEQMDFVVQEMISVFYKLFPPEMIGPMFEHQMRNTMLTLMADKENPGTIAEIPRMFSDPDFQKARVSKVKDPVVRAFWEKEMAKTSDFHKSEMLGYLISKVGRFVENTMMRNVIGQQRSGFDVEDIMNNGKIFLVNLSKGQVGDVNSALLGLIIVGKLTAAAFARVYIPEKDRRTFYLYIDEFQNYTTPSIATILSEARKYRLSLILAHQYIGQLVEKGDTKIKDAVFGNVGTMACYRIGVDDAEVMAKQFAPVFGEYDVVNIERFNAYLRMLIRNTAARAFNMATLAPTKGSAKIASTIRELSRLKYGRDRAIVEAEILERSQLGSAAKVADTSTIERSL